MHVHGFPFILKTRKDKNKKPDPKTQKSRLACGFCLALLKAKICSGCSRVYDLLPVWLWRQKNVEVCFTNFWTFLAAFLRNSTSSQTSSFGYNRAVILQSDSCFFLPLTCDSSRMKLSSGSQKCKHPPFSSAWWQWICLCFFQCFLCFAFTTVFVTCDDIGRREKVLPGCLSGSLGLSPLRFDLFSIWESRYFLPELWCNK